MTVKIPNHVKKNLKELKNYYIECAPELEQTAEECLTDNMGSKDSIRILMSWAEEFEDKECQKTVDWLLQSKKNFNAAFSAA